jgi:hypothetical protein
LELVRRTGVEYSLVIRARPDHMLVRRLDLRAFAADFAARASVQRARGHFLAMPERYQGQQVTDHFALGTLSAVWAYAARPLPYTAACCEGFVQRNLEMRCFARDEAVLEEEFARPAPTTVGGVGAGGAAAVRAAFARAADKDSQGWSMVPSELRASPYSPSLNNEHLPRLVQRGDGGMVRERGAVHRPVRRRRRGALLEVVGGRRGGRGRPAQRG